MATETVYQVACLRDHVNRREINLKLLLLDLQNYGHCSSGTQTLAAENRRPSRCVVETTVPEKQTSNFPTHELSFLRPGVTPPNVVGGSTISNASAQTQTGAYHVPWDVSSPTRRDSHRPENLSRDQPKREGTQIFRRQSTRAPLTYLPQADHLNPSAVRSYRPVPSGGTTPHQAEKTSTQTNALPTTILRYDSLFTHRCSHTRILNILTALLEITGQPSHLFALACVFRPRNFQHIK